MTSAHRLRSLVVPDGDGYGLARVVVAVRVAVVLSIVLLVATGPGWMRHHTAATAAVLGGALLYATVLMARPQFEVRRTRYSWLVAAVDATVTLTLIALTGGTASPVAVVLVLAVIAAAARLRFVECLVLASMVGTGYVLVVLVSGSDPDAVLSPPVQGLWWALYLVFIAVLTGGLSVLAEREHRSRVHALVEAEAEHAAAEEERDLRARLLRSYENQQEGLHVLLHEFRTPVASLDALAAALTDTASPMTPTDRDAAIALAGRHAQHLTDMLDALADVALSRRPTFSSGRVRRVDVAALIGEAGDAAGVQPPRLRVEVTGNLSAVQVDAQGLRRVLTNLLENAARHGRGLPIDVQCRQADHLLVISVLDRGPGVPQENLGELTEKWISLSDRRGTAGLGLWIVQQIIDALGGTLDFSARDGGGLAATFSVPIG
ncbi:MAG: HAMP domain-containing histidine kinase [Mycobacteriaceae bacterium]|nr:HAMP domain-containing histidine kinase [Mycobacteriaceae bacterium]